MGFAREEVYFIDPSLRNIITFSVLKRDKRGQLVRFYPHDYDTTSIMYARPYGYFWEECNDPGGEKSLCLTFPESFSFSIMESVPAERFIEQRTDSIFKFHARLGMYGGKYDEVTAAIMIPSDFEIVDFSSSRAGIWKKIGNTVAYYSQGIDTATLTVVFRLKEDTLYRKLVRILEKEKQVYITRIRRGIRVRLDESILFETGSAELKPESKELIKRIYQQLDFDRIKLLRVEGHTNNIPIRGKLKEKYPSNWELSTARASSVVRYLIELGAPRDKLVACGYADTKPIAPNETPEGREINKRVEFIIITGESEYLEDVKTIEKIREGTENNRSSP